MRLRARTLWRYNLFVMFFVGVPQSIAFFLATSYWFNIALGVGTAFVLPAAVLAILMQLGIAEVVFTRKDLKYWHMRFIYDGLGFFGEPQKGCVLEDDD